MRHKSGNHKDVDVSTLYNDVIFQSIIIAGNPVGPIPHFQREGPLIHFIHYDFHF